MASFAHLLVLICLGICAADFVALEAADNDSRYFFLGTDAGISKVDVPSGKVSWTTALGGRPVLVRHMHSSLFVAVGDKLHRIETEGGSFVWSAERHVVDLVKLSDGLVALTASEVVAYSLTGDVLWAVNADKSSTFLQVAKRKTEVCVLGSSGDVMMLDARTGSEKDRQDVPKELAGVIGADNVQAVGNHVAAIVGETLYSWPLCRIKRTAPLSWDLKNVRLAGKESSNFFLPWSGTARVFVVSNGHFTFFFRIADGKLQPWVNNALSRLGRVVGTSNLVFASSRKTGYEAKFITREFGDAGGFSIPSLSEELLPGIIAVLAFGPEPYRVLLCSKDKMVMVNHERVLWQVAEDGLTKQNEL